MLNTDEEALICDLAETYHIYDYKSLPARQVAIFSVGLRENSRIKLKMQSAKYPLETMLLACIADRLSFGQEKQKSILASMLGTTAEDKKDIETFITPEEFIRRRDELVRRAVRYE